MATTGRLRLPLTFLALGLAFLVLAGAGAWGVWRLVGQPSGPSMRTDQAELMSTNQRLDGLRGDIDGLVGPPGSAATPAQLRGCQDDPSGEGQIGQPGLEKLWDLHLSAAGSYGTRVVPLSNGAKSLMDELRAAGWIVTSQPPWTATTDDPWKLQVDRGGWVAIGSLVIDKRTPGGLLLFVQVKDAQPCHQGPGPRIPD